jgi:hypothetical protein
MGMDFFYGVYFFVVVGWGDFLRVYLDGGLCGVFFTLEMGGVFLIFLFFVVVMVGFNGGDFYWIILFFWGGLFFGGLVLF